VDGAVSTPPSSKVLPERGNRGRRSVASAAGAPLLGPATLNEPVHGRTKRLGAALDIIAAQDYT